MLLGLLKSQNLLARYASTLKVSGVGCPDKWASGSSDPRAGQGISAPSQVVRGCGDWP